VTYYDREADVLLVELLDDVVERSTEREWGLLDLAEDGRTVALEVWDASRRLPAELLAALPLPPARRSMRAQQPA
jgi:uncharacterized protein YuzE